MRSKGTCIVDVCKDGEELQLARFLNARRV